MFYRVVFGIVLAIGLADFPLPLCVNAATADSTLPNIAFKV